MEPYRPSNGFEGMDFMERYCARCIHDNPETEDYCEILSDALLFDLKDKDYPRDKWVYVDDEPTCLAFEERYRDD